MANEQFLIDTNILIDYLKGDLSAVEFINNLSVPPVISVLPVAEIYSGAKENEMAEIEEFLSAFRIINVDYEIAQTGGLFRNKYFKSHGVCLADGIIAATAILNDLKLSTLNTKHFHMLDNVIRPY
jgi:hypothetical protein